VKNLHLIGAAAVSAAVAIAAFAFTGDAQTAGRTIVLKESDKGSLVNFIDNLPHSSEQRGAPVASLGDGLAISTRLQDPAGNRAGRIEAACSDVKQARLQDGAVFLCTAVAHLADGDIFLSARFAPVDGPSDVHGALTGGTGAYLGARGDFTSVGRPATDTFSILP
jgi:hypothetical protein